MEVVDFDRRDGGAGPEGDGGDHAIGESAAASAGGIEEGGCEDGIFRSESHGWADDPLCRGNGGAVDGAAKEFALRDGADADSIACDNPPI